MNLHELLRIARVSAKYKQLSGHATCKHMWQRSGAHRVCFTVRRPPLLRVASACRIFRTERTHTINAIPTYCPAILSSAATTIPRKRFRDSTRARQARHDLRRSIARQCLSATTAVRCALKPVRCRPIDRNSIS